MKRLQMMRQHSSSPADALVLGFANDESNCSKINLRGPGRSVSCADLKLEGRGASWYRLSRSATGRPGGRRASRARAVLVRDASNLATVSTDTFAAAANSLAAHP
jgi:hypothetical protein